MSIVCGTDFSTNAGLGAYAAGAMAKRLGVPLTLVHVVDADSATTEIGQRPASTCEDPRTRLDVQAEAIRAEFGVDVASVVALGGAHEALMAIARSSSARLLVLSSVGENQQSRWRLGRVTERVVQASPIPVLVVRGGRCIEAWARGYGRLQVMVGVERTPASKAALHWAGALRRVGPCTLLVVQVAEPADERQRRVPPSPSLDEAHPELEPVLARDLEQWAGERSRPGEISYSIVCGWGQIDRHITLLAADTNVDLIVVGAHQAGTPRPWRGSVPRGVLHAAHASVACVPRGETARDEEAAFRIFD